MEQRIIKLQVSNEFIIGSGVSIGAVGSHDDVLLELDFRQSRQWDDTTRRATFANALGENLTPVLLTTDLLEEGQSDVYLLPVPGEAKEVAGECFLSIEGFVMRDGIEIVRVATDEATFRVLPSKLYSGSDGSVTPTSEERLQAEIDMIKASIADSSTSAKDAENSKSEASVSAQQAAQSAAAARAAQTAAELARDQAQAVASGDFATRTEAQQYAQTAEDNAKAYTNNQIAAVLIVGTSGAIKAHNTDQSAHEDIRDTLNSHAGRHAADGADPLTPEDIGAESAGAVETHDGDENAHGGLRAYVTVGEATAQALGLSAGATVDACFGALAGTLGDLSAALDDLNGEVV